MLLINLLHLFIYVSRSKRVLIAHDGRIYCFRTDTEGKGVVGSVLLAYVPKTGDHSLIWEQSNFDNAVDYLCLRDHATTSTNPCWTRYHIFNIKYQVMYVVSPTKQASTITLFYCYNNLCFYNLKSSSYRTQIEKQIQQVTLLKIICFG